VKQMEKRPTPEIDFYSLVFGGEDEFRNCWSTREISVEKWFIYSPFLILIVFFLFFLAPNDWEDIFAFQVVVLLYFVMMLPAVLSITLFRIRYYLTVRRRIFGEEYFQFAEEQYKAKNGPRPFYETETNIEEKKGSCPNNQEQTTVWKKKKTYLHNVYFQQRLPFRFTYLVAVDGSYSNEEVQKKA